jgi:hypothetical protein
MKAQTITGTVKTLNREKSSGMGNPRYTLLIITDAGDIEQVTTRPNSSHGYSATNYENKRVTVTASISRNRLSLDTIEEVQA